MNEDKVNQSIKGLLAMLGLFIIVVIVGGIIVR